MTSVAPQNSSLTLLAPPAGLGQVAPCAPKRAAEFQIEGRLVTRNVWVDVRRYRWSDYVEGPLDPSDQLCYLGLSLGGRAADYRIALSTPTWAAPFERPGEIMYVPAGLHVQARAAPSVRRVVCLMFRPGAGESLIDESWSGEDARASLDIRNPSIRASLLCLAKEALSPGFASDVLADALAASITVELARYFRAARTGAAARAGALAPWQMRLIRERVEAGLGIGATIADLARDCRISVRHLSRAFKASAGVTLGDYIAEARVRRAKALLAGTRSSVKDIAAACDFRSQGAFGTAFRRAAGVTPREFRKACQAGFQD